MKKETYRKDIDGLRMLAVMPVVLNHASLPGFPGGFIGVDIFFVVSGYLITQIIAREIEENSFSIISFYERRARRILPALFAMLTVCIVAGWWLLSAQRYDALAKSVVATLSFASNFWFWDRAGDYFGPNVEFEPLLHTWSLAVEEQFYLFFPILMILIARFSRSVWLFIIWAIVLGSFFLSLWLTQSAPTANFYLVPTRAWELGAGSLLALRAFPSFGNRIVNEGACWFGLVLIVASILLITHETPFPGLAALPAVAGTVLFINGGTHQNTSASRILSWAPFVWIGLISYSLYIWHWPILVAAREINNSAHLPLPIALLCVLLSIGIAWVSWKYVEQPFRKKSSGREFSSQWIFGSSAGGIVLLAILSAIIVKSDGFVGQFPKERIAVYREAITRGSLDQDCVNRNVESACLIGAADILPSIAVWGDSHSAAALAGFDVWLGTQDRSALAFSKAACPPLIGVYRSDQKPDHNCDQHNAKVLAYIADTPSIKTVVLFGRWALATEGTRAERESGKPARLAERGQPVVDISDNHLLVEKGLGRLVEALRASQINVILVEGTAEIGFNVPEVVLRQGEAIPDQFLPMHTEVRDRNARADGILESVATAHDALLLSPRQLMCDERCAIQIEGKPLFRDDDHLSSFGARWLIPKLMDGVTLP